MLFLKPMIAPSPARFTTKMRPHAQYTQTGAPASWQQRAVIAYEQAEQDESVALQRELADRIAALTEHRLAPESIYVNRAAQLAVANVEGTVFRLLRHDLMIVRPCVECGTGQYESPRITSIKDLGYALSAWEPRCADCRPIDPINWIDD